MQKIKNNYGNGRYTMLTPVVFYVSLLKAIVKHVFKRSLNDNAGTNNIVKRCKPLDAFLFYNVTYFWWLEAWVPLIIVLAGFLIVPATTSRG